MHSTLALAALAAIAYAAPQGVTQKIPPSAPAPAGCKASYDGKFQIAAVALAKRDIEKRQSNCGEAGSLTITLADGVLLDSQARTGYIAANYQFQFDKPAQTGAIYTSGFSACANNTLALGGSTIFYRCLSGEFYNLYDRSWAAQCSPITFEILPCSGGAAPPNGIGQIGDGQVTGTKVGQPVTQIGDGQVQAPTGAPKPPVTQIGDGQIQAPTNTYKPAPVTQIGDGQIQAPPASNKPAPVTQIGDGQVQAPTGAPKPPVTQIGDGQIQAPTGKPSPKPAPVTQIGDGQIQAPTGKPSPKPAPVTQIADGQIQAPTGTKKSNITTPSATPTQFTGSASTSNIGSVLAIVILGVFTSIFL